MQDSPRQMIIDAYTRATGSPPVEGMTTLDDLIIQVLPILVHDEVDRRLKELSEVQ